MLAASSGRSAHGWRRFPHADAHVLPLHHTGDEHSPPGSLSQLSCPRCRPNSAPSPRKWPPRTASRPADSKGSVRTQRAPEPTLGRRAPCTVPGSSAAWGRQCGLGYHPPSAHSSRGRTHRVRSLQPAGQHGGCCGQALPAQPGPGAAVLQAACYRKELRAAISFQNVSCLRSRAALCSGCFLPPPAQRNWGHRDGTPALIPPTSPQRDAASTRAAEPPRTPPPGGSAEDGHGGFLLTCTPRLRSASGLSPRPPPAPSSPQSTRCAGISAARPFYARMRFPAFSCEVEAVSGSGELLLEARRFDGVCLVPKSGSSRGLSPGGTERGGGISPCHTAPGSGAAQRGATAGTHSWAAMGEQFSISSPAAAGQRRGAHSGLSHPAEATQPCSVGSQNGELAAAQEQGNPEWARQHRGEGGVCALHGQGPALHLLPSTNPGPAGVPSHSINQSR